MHSRILKCPAAMSYTVLARKYRSADFDEVIGQEPRRADAQEGDRVRPHRPRLPLLRHPRHRQDLDRPHPRQGPQLRESDGPTAKPCGKCDSCLAIARGEDIDVHRDRRRQQHRRRQRPRPASTTSSTAPPAAASRSTSSTKSTCSRRRRSTRCSRRWRSRRST